MIDLKMVRQTLEALDRQEITQEDVLGVYVDLNEAVRLSGSSVSSLPVNDPLKLAEYLAVCGTDFLRITRSNAAILSEEDPTGRLSNRKEKIEQRMQGLEQQIRSMSERQAEIESKEKVLAEKEKEADEKNARLISETEALDRKEKQVAELERANRDLEKEIMKLKTLSVQDAEERKRSLEQEIEAVKKELDEAERRCEDISVKIAAAEERLNTAKQRRDQSEEKAGRLKTDNEYIQGILEKLEGEIASEESKHSELFRRYKALTEANESMKVKQASLSEIQTEMSRLEEENSSISAKLENENKQLEERKSELAVRRAETEALGEKLAEKRKAAADEEAELDKRAEELSGEAKEIRTIEERCAELKDMIAQLNETTLPEAKKSFESLSSQKEELEKSAGRLKWEFSELSAEIQRLSIEKQKKEQSGYEKKIEVARLKDDVNALNESYAHDSELIKQLIDEKAGVEYRRDRLREQRDACKQELEQLQRDFSTEKARFDREEVPEHNRKIEFIKSKLRLISELKSDLEKEISIGVISGNQESEQLTAELEKLIENFERDATRIEQKYVQITQILDE